MSLQNINILQAHGQYLIQVWWKMWKMINEMVELYKTSY